MKHIFVINPIAGKQNNIEEFENSISSSMSKLGFNYEIVRTTAPNNVRQDLENIINPCEETKIYACGGDGTLNDVVNGTINYENVYITHYPMGSGNDFIKIFGDCKDKFRDLDNFSETDYSEFDLIEANERYCINISSIGIDARIGVEMSKYKKLPFISGKAAYILSVVFNVIKGINKHMIIDIDNVHLDNKYALVCACNGRYYGGGFNPVPDAVPNDKTIDVLVVKKCSRFTVASIVGKYAKGKYKDYPELITHYRTDTLTVSTDKITPINVDGEILPTNTVIFKISDKKVKFFYPKGLSF